jgi:hypothetical protein
MKFKLPPSIPLMPQWHHTQFKELLVVVENFGMPHFFLTLIYDETSNLHGKKLKTLKILQCFSITNFLGRIVQLNAWHYFAQGCKLSCQPMFLVMKTLLALSNIM